MCRSLLDCHIPYFAREKDQNHYRGRHFQNLFNMLMAICLTISRYRKLKADYLKEQDKCSSANALDCYDLSLLLESWKPISFGHKGRWCDCIALQDDVDSSDEASFRMEIRELANMSLQLLKAAIFDKECESLFSLEIYGHIIGMFELNNLTSK